jgi:hypothetical protein
MNVDYACLGTRKLQVSSWPPGLMNPPPQLTGQCCYKQVLYMTETYDLILSLVKDS